MMNRRDALNRTDAGSASEVQIDTDSNKNNDTNTACQSGRGSRALAETNQAAAVMEDGHDLQDDPFVLALLTGMEQMEQMEQRSQTEKEKIGQFQDNIRSRVKQAHVLKRRLQRQKTSQQVDDCEQRSHESPQQPENSYQQHDSHPLSPSSSYQQHDVSHLLSPSSSSYLSALDVCSPHADEWEAPDSTDNNGEHGTTEQRYQQQPSKDVKQVRHRLAKCQILTDGEMMPELPTRDKPVSITLGAGDKPKEGDVPCPLVQQNVHPGQTRAASRGGLGTGMVPCREHPGAGSRTSPTVPRVFWSLADLQEIKEQHLSRFARLRRLFMDIEREQVQERQRKSERLECVARIKRDREQTRLKEERSLRKQRAAVWRMEERELLVLERLQLEEEQRAAEVEEKRKPQVKDRTTFAEALRARLRERLPQEKVVDLPPLCCCGDAFWDANPDTCADNCVFYKNPKAYVKALQSAVCGAGLQEGSSAFYKQFCV